jgi:hypothetical protein
MIIMIIVGEKAWRNPYVRKWWEESGQYWYNGTKK